MFLLFFDVCKINVDIFICSPQQKDKSLTNCQIKRIVLLLILFNSSVYSLSSEYTLGNVLS